MSDPRCENPPTWPERWQALPEPAQGVILVVAAVLGFVLLVATVAWLAAALALLGPWSLEWLAYALPRPPGAP